MAQSAWHQPKAHPGEGYLYDEDDVLSFVHEASNQGASEWSHSFVVHDGFHPAAIAPTVGGLQHLGPQDLVFIDPEWSDFAFAKGGSGGGGTTTSGYTPAPYTAGGAANYNIRIEFKGSWTAELYDGFTAAADLLCTYISGDLPNVLFRGKVIDDIVITAELKPIDGTGGILGQAGPTAVRSGSYLPAIASMQFDSADALQYQNQGLWNDIVLHEMVHSLGFGTIWSYLGLVSGSTFTGTHAVAAYGKPVPVEQDGGGGTAGSHWDEGIFTNEIMTGYIDPSNYISDVTWASLADLGYKLNPYQDYLLV